MSARVRVTALVGPTASGKSDLALDICSHAAGEIVSIDSAMVYKGMDIGTDKPTAAHLQQVPHHLIDVVDPSHTISVAEFQRMARSAIGDISSRGALPLLVGGAGLYFRAVVDPLTFPGTDPQLRAGFELEAGRLGTQSMYERLRELDPEAASRIEPGNARRIVRALEVIELTGRPFSSFRQGWDEYESQYDLRVAGLSWPREELDRRINSRVDGQVERGLVDEVKGLVQRGLRDSLTSAQALGYAQVLKFIDGVVPLDEAIEEIKKRTRRYARRQLSWFGADPRVVWFEGDPRGAAEFLLSEWG